MNAVTLSRAQRQRPLRPPQRQRGIALLVAILLVALGTMLAAKVAYENAMTARKGTSTFALDQAILIGEGSEALAAYGLRQIRQSDPTHTYPGQGWATPVGPMEVVPGVMLTAQVEDLQGRFNLNSLVQTDGTPDPVNVAAFTTLLELLGLEPKWAGLMVDWIDADIVPQNPDGAEDSVYMGQTPPYRTANRYITSASELLALPGFGYTRYKVIAPYVVALPVTAKINICTASGLVLDAFLGEGHTEFSADAAGLQQNRTSANGCFPTLANYQAAFPKNGFSGSTSTKFAQNSSYFRLTSFVTIGSTEFNLYSLLYQDQTGAVRAIQRSFTTD
jgi:general secretion pathway protein K